MSPLKIVQTLSVDSAAFMTRERIAGG